MTGRNPTGREGVLHFRFWILDSRDPSLTVGFLPVAWATLSHPMRNKKYIQGVDACRHFYPFT